MYLPFDFCASQFRLVHLFNCFITCWTIYYLSLLSRENCRGKCVWIVLQFFMFSLGTSQCQRCRVVAKVRTSMQLSLSAFRDCCLSPLWTTTVGKRAPGFVSIVIKSNCYSCHVTCLRRCVCVLIRRLISTGCDLWSCALALTTEQRPSHLPGPVKCVCENV